MFLRRFEVQPPKYTFSPPRDWLSRLRNLINANPQDDLSSTEALCCRVVGDFTAGIVLHRLLYWLPKGSRRDDSIWKSDKEWYAELNLSYAQMQRVRAKLSPIVKSWVEKAMGAPTYHYQLKVDELVQGIATVLNCPIIKIQLALLDKTENGFSGKPRMDFRLSRKTITNQHQSPHQIDSYPDSLDLILPAPAEQPQLPETEEIQRARQSWELAHNQMKLQFDRETFINNLQTAHFISFSDNTFRIGVSALHIRDNCQLRLYRPIRRILTDCHSFGQPVEIIFEHTDSAPAEASTFQPPQPRQYTAAPAKTAEALLIDFGLNPTVAQRWAHLNTETITSLIEAVRQQKPRSPVAYLTASLKRLDKRTPQESNVIQL